MMEVLTHNTNNDEKSAAETGLSHWNRHGGA